MKTLTLIEMEGLSASGLNDVLAPFSGCGVLLSVGIGALFMASGVGGFGGLFVGTLLAEYAARAFC